MNVEVFDKGRISAVFMGGFLLLILLLTIYLIKPILLALGLTVVQVYFFHPAIIYLLPKVKKRSTAIVVLSILFLVPFTVFLVFLTSTIAAQLIELSKIPAAEEVIELAGGTVKDYFAASPAQSFSLSTITKGFEKLIGLFSLVGGVLIQVFLASLLTAYVLYKEDDLTEFVHSIRNQKVRNYIHFVDEGLKQIVYSMFLTALVTGAIATVLYFLFKVPFAILLGALTAVVALIPILGAWLVYLPVGLYILYQGNTVFGLVFLGLSIVLISTVPDIVVRPIIICRCEHVNLGLLILGFVTGSLAFGPVGVILGPLIVISLVGNA
jgi:predicted PurR-regulated permease PerM